MKPDLVFIEGLQVAVKIGAYGFERELIQCLQLDVCCAFDIRPAAASDDLNLALDYARLSQSIAEFAQGTAFELLETFAERLAAHLLDEFKLSWLRLKLVKPAVNPLAARVGLEIERPCR